MDRLIGCSLLENKKIMVIVPHEDDEINLAGGILSNVKNSKVDVTVVFVTNGDYYEYAEVRQKEAKNSLRVFGVQESDIVFLGYSDQLYENNSHIYMEEEQWISNKGVKETSRGIYDDYHYKRFSTHSRFNRYSLINDMKLIILEKMPEMIFCVDFDSHSDHRATSLAFEHAMGEILNEHKDYMPRVFKGFAYPTAYKGIQDFIFDKSTKFLREANNKYEMQNPYYLWEERVRFPVSIKARSSLLYRNTIYKALAKHRSQLIIKQYAGIINNDQIFWQRRTDNLLRNAEIKVSSGNKQYLNDFLLFDCKDIMHGDRVEADFNMGVWKPEIDDDVRGIDISFSNMVNINRINLYQGCDNNDKITRIRVAMNNGFCQEYSLENGLCEKIYFERQLGIEKINITILERTGSGAGISELELLDDSDSKLEYIKILNGEDFLYSFSKEDKNNIKIYAYNGIKGEEFDIEPEKFVLSEEVIGHKKYIKASVIDNEEIYDYVPIKKEFKIHFGIVLLNALILNSDYVFDRVQRKLRNTIRNIFRKN